jgi:hypothetical protein
MTYNRQTISVEDIADIPLVAHAKASGDGVKEVSLNLENAVSRTV